MATTSSLPTFFNLRFQRFNVGTQIQIPSISLLGPRKNPRIRFGNVVSLRTRERLHKVFALNTDPPSADEKNKERETSTAQGPPFFTILAGFLVLFLFCWIVGSIVLWLVGLIVNITPRS